MDNISCIKESTGDLTRITSIRLLTNDQIAIIAGWESSSLQAFMAGATGWAPVCTNFFPRLAMDFFRAAVDEADITKARILWDRLFPLCEFIRSKSHIRAAHTGLDLLNRSVGSPRRPLRTQTARIVRARSAFCTASQRRPGKAALAGSGKKDVRYIESESRSSPRSRISPRRTQPVPRLVHRESSPSPSFETDRSKTVRRHHRATNARIVHRPWRASSGEAAVPGNSAISRFAAGRSLDAARKHRPLATSTCAGLVRRVSVM